MSSPTDFQREEQRWSDEDLEHEPPPSYPRRLLRRAVTLFGNRSDSINLGSRVASLSRRLDTLVREASERDVDVEMDYNQASWEASAALQALRYDDTISFWRHFSEARKLELVIIERIYHERTDEEFALTPLDRLAQNILLEAADVLNTRQRVKVETELSRRGSLDQYYRNIISAIHLIHRQQISDYMERERGRFLESQLLFFISVITGCLLVLFYVWIQAFGMVGVTETTPLFSIPFIITIVLFGAMGAAVSSLMNLSDVVQTSKIPDRVGSM
jgi:hypothetical protein